MNSLENNKKNTKQENENIQKYRALNPVVRTEVKKESPEEVRLKIELLEKELRTVIAEQNIIANYIENGDKARVEFNQALTKLTDRDGELEQLSSKRTILESELQEIKSRLVEQEELHHHGRGDILDLYVDEYENLLKQIKKEKKKGKNENPTITNALEEKSQLLYKLTEELQLPVEELEDRLNTHHLMKWFIVENFSEQTKENINLKEWAYVEEDFLPEHIATLCETEKATQKNHFTVSFMLGGLQLQLVNPSQARNEKGDIDVLHPDALFNVVGADDMVIKAGNNIPLPQAENLMEMLAKEHGEQTIKAFDSISDKDAWNEQKIRRLEKDIDAKIVTYTLAEQEITSSIEKNGSAEDIEKWSLIQSKELEAKKLAKQAVREKIEADPIIEAINDEIEAKQYELDKNRHEMVTINAQIKMLSKTIEKLDSLYHYDKEDFSTTPEDYGQKHPQRVGPGIYRQHTALVRPKRNISEDELKMRAEGITATREEMQSDTDFLAELERRTQNRMNIAQGLPPMSEDELKNVPAKNVESPITQAPGLSPEEKAEIQKQIDQIEKRRAERKIAIEKFNKDFEEKIKALEDQLKKLEKEKNEDRLGTLNKMYEFLKDYEIISNVPIEKQIDIPKEQLVKIAEELKYKNVETMLGGISFGTNESIAKAKKDLIQKIEKVLPANKI